MLHTHDARLARMESRRRDSMRLTLVLLLMLLAAGDRLEAQQPERGRDGVWIGGFSGIYAPLAFDFQAGENAFELDDTRAVVGARLGYTFDVNVFVEGSVAYTPLRYELAGSPVNLNTFIYTGAVGYNFSIPPAVELFLLAGGGVTQWKATGRSAENDLEVLFGGGFRVYVTDGLAVRVGVRDHILPETLTDLRQSLNPALVLEDELTHNLEITASVSLFFGVNRDSDADRVFNRYDVCPNTPPGAKADAYGCPLDGDRDRVADYLDRCPGTPVETAVDTEGCPLDSDADAIADDRDRCPGTPAGATVDPDGCPLDPDDDGVFSGLDGCPNTPSGAEVDENGCPRDADGDGVYDGLDRCPNTPEAREVDEDGCSRIQAGLEAGRLVLSSIYFLTNSAELAPASRRVLDDVGRALLDRPTQRIEIEGHTDARGSASYNLELSEERATAVFEYLVRAFPALDRSRFEVRGYGESRPIASNDSADGRSMNRRVEFRVLGTE